MKKTGFFIVVLSTILAGCAGGAASVSRNATNVEATSPPSKPLLDEPAGVADQKQTTTLSTANASSNSMASTAKSQTVVATSRLRHLNVCQQVSLIKAEQVSES